MKAFDKHVFNKIVGCKFCKLAVERDYQHRVNSGQFKTFQFFAEGLQQFYFGMMREYQSWMRFKGNYYRFAVFFDGNGRKPADNFHMTQVNTIKHANRCHGMTMRIKIRNLAVYTHGQEWVS